MEFDPVQIWDGGWVGAMLRGAALTIAVALVSVLAGFLVGMVCGLVKWARIQPFGWLVDVYTTIVRGVPELLIIYMLFFSSIEFISAVATAFGYQGLADLGYPFLVAVVAIGAISGAYSTEVIRGALAAIPKGHLEAAQALGLARTRIFRRIIVPQMLRVAIPGMNNVWQVTIKDTALVSVVGLQELMRTASIGANTTRHPFIFYLLAAGLYFAITLVSQFVVDGGERFVRHRGRA